MKIDETEFEVEYKDKEIILIRYLGNKRKVEIPYGITSIASDSMFSLSKKGFAECAFLEEVILPGTLISIGDFAFSRCTSLWILNENLTGSMIVRLIADQMIDFTIVEDKSTLTVFPLIESRISHDLPNYKEYFNKFFQAVMDYSNDNRKLECIISTFVYFG